MRKSKTAIKVVFTVLSLGFQIWVSSYEGTARQAAAWVRPVLWHNPVDIPSRNLFYGSGGRENVPEGPFSFIEEDLSGTNPKFQVRDGHGVKWQAKLGIEARTETAASRLLWAVGYPTDDYYYFPDLRIENLPSHLHRGQKLIAPDGTMHNLRLRRHPGEKKVGSWRWDTNPFVGTQEYNGLRVMMALINNWDLKDENNSIYRKEGTQTGIEEELYMVTDLGASFGSTGRSWPASKSKGNLETYSRSVFIRNITRNDVDLSTPTRPALFYLVNLPEFFRRLALRWIGRRISRSDAKWIGHLLAQLTADQIRDAFRAAGFTVKEANDFTQIVLRRIADLNGL